MHYHIRGLCPSEHDPRSAGFSIVLYPEWRDLVAATTINQTMVNQAVNTMGRRWLDGCGYSQLFDPDNCGFNADPKKAPGPKARHLYEPGPALRVQWGPWGPEHITIPGDACGLDLDEGISAPPDGRVLLPHNVDTIRQAHLLLVVFTWFADTLILSKLSEHKRTTK